MNRIFLIICLLLPVTALAQRYPDNRFRMSLGGTFHGTMGQQHFQSSDRFITGNSRSGGGAYLEVAKPVFAGFMVGARISFSGFSLVSSAIKDQLLEKYGRDGYYISYDVDRRGYTISQIGFSLARNFDFRGGTVSPYARISVASIDDMNPTASIRLKRKGDNYFVQYTIAADQTPDGQAAYNFLLTTVGCNLEGRLNDYFWIQGGMSYTGGSYKLNLKEITTDIYGQNTPRAFEVKQPVSMINLSLGLQVRFGRN